MALNPNRQFVLKFAIPDLKKLLALECGHRVHTTHFDLPTTQTPSNFVAKLRKHLKTRRLTGIRQVGDDRVLVLLFSDGLYYLVLEFFSAGNILLLDADFKILMLNRVVREQENVDRYAVNETYGMFSRELMAEKPKLVIPPVPDAPTVQKWIVAHKEALAKSTKAKKKVYLIHKLLFVHMPHLPADLLLRELARDGVNKLTSALEFECDETKLEQVVAAIRRATAVYEDLMTSPVVTGYLVLKKNPSYDANDEHLLEWLLDEFHPFEPFKMDTNLYKIEPVEGYNATVDRFFSTIESSKNLVRIERQKLSAANRLALARSDRDRQIQLLVEQQEANRKRGDAIVFHADAVAACLALVGDLVAQQMDWTNIESYLQLEQRKKNPVATAIRLPLKLAENKIQLELRDPDVEVVDSDSELESELESLESLDLDLDSDLDSDLDDELRLPKKKAQRPKKPSGTLTVWVDITLSPYANAATYFDTKKLAESKQVKVEKNTEMALKNAERKINQDLNRALKEEEAGGGGQLRQLRPKFWFEKFFWFVTSDGYLCLAGKDLLQLDMIYFRHVSDNDFVVLLDVEGSLRVFIKNPFKGEDVPPSTLMQASIYALSLSTAWSNKVLTLAWVVLAAEILKKDVDGTLLQPGEFNVRGKKEYMPPVQLVMGFGVYLLGDEETTKKYRTKREEKYAEHGLSVVMDTKKKDLEELAKLKFKHEGEKKPEEAESAGAEATEGEEQSQDQPAEETPEPESSDATPEPGNAPKKVRGKKAKLKKIQAKYADQDEEDRKLRMEALGTLKQVKQQQAQQAEAAKAHQLEKQKQQQKQEAAARKMKQNAKEYLKYVMSDDHDADEASEVNYMNILDEFIAKPQRGDQFVGCVPVFAPWAALGKNKYKVKIQPGAGKKGKCVSELIHHWTTRKLDPTMEDPDADWPTERSQVEGIKQAEALGVFTVNKVRLALPGSEGKGNKGGDKGKKPPQKGGKKKK